MAQPLIYSILSVKLGPVGIVNISGKDLHGADIEISIATSAVQNLAGPLLCAAAIEMSPQPRPAEGTELTYGCLLPIIKWETGRVEFNKEPVLRLYVSGAALQFQLAAQTAIECGKALEAQGNAALPPEGTRLN